MAVDLAQTSAASSGKRKRLENEGEESLLPGILDEISVDLIAAKLAWREICLLSCVSRGWRQAVRSHDVYNARRRFGTTETLSLISSRMAIPQDDSNKVLFDPTKRNSSFQLPCIPGYSKVPTPVPGASYAPLNGRIYAMGGEKKSQRTGKNCSMFSNEVYAFDLAGEKKWKRCANMIQARGSFGSAVLGRRIYVFGGCQCTYTKNGTKIPKPVYGSEVYDPQKNTWTSIKAMPNWRFRHSVVAGRVAGKEVLAVQGGHVGRPQFKSGKSWKYEMTSTPKLEIYNPGSDTWSVCSLPDGRTTPTGTTITLGDPGSLIDWIEANKTRSSGRLLLSV